MLHMDQKQGLLSVGFNLKPDDASFNVMRDEYLAIYDQVLTRSPALFDGVDELLTKLESKGILWGVVTNKPRRFTVPLLESINLMQRAACVVCGDDVKEPKPDPASLLLACQQAIVQPQDCWYVGDAERDIQAGNAAGMKTVVAMYGYLDAADKPEEWGSKDFIHKALDTLAMLI